MQGFKIQLRLFRRSHLISSCIYLHYHLIFIYLYTYQIDRVQNSWLKNSKIFFRLPHLIYSCLLSAASTLPTMVGITQFTKLSCLFLLNETDYHWLSWKWQWFHGFLDKNLKFRPLCLLHMMNLAKWYNERTMTKDEGFLTQAYPRYLYNLGWN